MQLGVIAVSIAALLSASLTHAREPLRFEDEPHVMLYFKKPIGARNSKAGAPVLGLSLHQSSTNPSMLFTYNPQPALDLQWSLGEESDLSLNGLSFDSNDSSSNELWGEWWFWGLVAVAGAGTMCALEWLLCEGDEGYEPGRNYYGGGT